MTEPRNKENWADPADTFHIKDAVTGVPRGNVEGRRTSGPLQGFGQLWEKTFEVSIPGPTPEELVATWKAKFGEFWHPLNEFHAPAAGIVPGEVVLIGAGRGPLKMTTAVRVIYADDRCWTYITPEGHPFAGLITFSAYPGPAESTVAQIQLYVRANDPIYEIGFKLFTSKMEDRIWTYTLEQVAAHFGVANPDVRCNVALIDKKRQWNQFSNIYKNSVVRSLLHRDRHLPD